MLHKISSKINNAYNDFLFLYFGLVKSPKRLKIKYPELFMLTAKEHFRSINDRRKYILKKYIYTINHKRIALNYLYFSFITGLSGSALATMIRLELSYPGSPFFKGDSLRYLQVITAHGLIMVFFVVVPILFGSFANFVIPYHVGSKDVAFPRLNSIAFWLLPCGYILVSKTAFLRPQF
jgi:heme/copper-type cytochrome/quinol oxidase subunit 1